jgi:cytochrome c oxidase subunit III
MRSFFSTVSTSSPKTILGDAGILPPRGGDGDDQYDYGWSNFEMRLRRARLGLLVGLTSILMVFASLTSAYLVRQGLPTFDPRTDTMVHDWLPVRLPGILLVNTCVLLISSVTMELGRRSARAQVSSIPGVSLGGQVRIFWLSLTLLLGLSFLSGQWVAWRQLTAGGFDVAATPSSSFVYLLTGMHGVHLLGGILALVFAGGAAVLHRPAESRAVVLDVTGWYWHSMAFLWVYILCLLKFVR